MENLSIYDFVGYETDPIYSKLQQLNSSSDIEIDGFKISKNKFFEVENSEIHVGFKTLEACYQFLSNIIPQTKGEQS